MATNPSNDTNGPALPGEGNVRDFDSGESAIEACEVKIEPSGLRRLQHSEYRQTVRDLFPGVDLPAYVLTDDPDEHGFLNRAELLGVPDLLMNDYRQASAKIATAVASAGKSVTDCDPSESCGLDFIERLLPKAFGHPVSAEDRAPFESLFKDVFAEKGFESAHAATVQAVLLYPDFLYRFETEGAPDGDGLIPVRGYDMANRLSFLFWGSRPDQGLLDAAESGDLNTVEGIADVAKGMLDDPRADDMLTVFHQQWLSMDRIYAEPKDEDKFPEYTAQLRDDMREEADRFTKMVMEGSASAAELLTSNKTELTERLAAFYGVDGIDGDGWTSATLDPDERAGYLTRANWLAAKAHALRGNPALRAVFVDERVFCSNPRTPPEDADTSPIVQEEGKNLTNRELFAARVESEKCAGCHAELDKIGYAFETYDAVGAYRQVEPETGREVDTSSVLEYGLDIDGPIEDAIDLSNKLAESEGVKACVTKNMFTYAVGRSMNNRADRCTISKLKDAFVSSGGDMKAMLLELTQTPAFLYRQGT